MEVYRITWPFIAASLFLCILAVAVALYAFRKKGEEQMGCPINPCGTVLILL